MKIKHSVSTRIANYLFIIIVFASIITSLSLAIMASNKSDAELINVSGSLRMQSYRLIYTMQYYPSQVEQDLRRYRVSLHSQALVDLNNHFLVSENVKQAYRNLIQRWQVMEHYVRTNNQQAYRANIADYVDQVDQFVYTLQQYAEKKLIIVVVIICVSMLLIVAMVSYVIFYTRKQVVIPLHQLAKASGQVQMGIFNHVKLNTEKEDELGMLARVFTKMANDLHKLYYSLEQQVDEKTKKLSQINRTLSTLYYCSQQLSRHELNQSLLKQVLSQVYANEHLRYLDIEIYQQPQLTCRLGEPVTDYPWQCEHIMVEGECLGELRWQAGFPCPDKRTIENVVQMLARSLYFSQTQRQQQQLLLMEERSIIARELHDSLAQVLSFLQIQLTLLKHNTKDNSAQAQEKRLAIIAEFEQALRDGYIQLRELLATFRLTIQEANLTLALEQVIASLQSQTTMNIHLDCSLPSQTFNAQQQVHALQIVREAILNAIKHSQGTDIYVIAHTNEEGEREIMIRDNGVGIASLQEPEGHYGLNIMQERANQLNATLSISQAHQGGTLVCIRL
ncbi:two-component system nitrate/nitrite sensor histidine kinase NarQ [Volucribacter psittacicida]|uniref:Sensor protein n=1 Tax=Volucribacter psittacicida TaxID=203482 RepID=A0A4V6NCP1_9PAST|nr:nitrate/nitrite two-component system sensor histidine kinase NarQ [Volucribacter psittacicida]TCJ95885.1 two-component system nitrate/nitrite sensor histidine kinase NarQ [Volucribacter psittacicida]